MARRQARRRIRRELNGRRLIAEVFEDLANEVILEVAFLSVNRELDPEVTVSEPV